MERNKCLIGTNGSSIAAESRQTDVSTLCALRIGNPEAKTACDVGVKNGEREAMASK